jgi:hypothetical protein
MLHGNKISVVERKTPMTAGFSCSMILFALQKLMRGRQVIS